MTFAGIPVEALDFYKGLRFAKCRSPYKEQQGATVGDHYLHVSAAGLFAATGYYQMAPDQVARYREAVDDDATGPKLEKVVARLRDADYTVGGDALKTHPRGYPPDHPLIDLLRHKALVVSTEFGAPAWLHTAEAAERLAVAWREMEPLTEWLNTHVGPTREPRR